MEPQSSTMDTGLDFASLPQEIIDQIIERAAEINPPLYEGYTGEESDEEDEDRLPPTTQRTLAIMARLSTRFRNLAQQQLLSHLAFNSIEQVIKWANDAPMYPTISLEFNDWFGVNRRFPRELAAKRCAGLKRLVIAVNSIPGGIDEGWLRSPELSELKTLQLVSGIPSSTTATSTDVAFRLQSLDLSYHASRTLSPEFFETLFRRASTSLLRLKFTDRFFNRHPLRAIALPLVQANVKHLDIITMMGTASYNYEDFTSVTHLTLATDYVCDHLPFFNSLPALTHLTLKTPYPSDLTLVSLSTWQSLQRLDEIRFVNQDGMDADLQEVVTKIGLAHVSIVFGHAQSTRIA